MVSRINALHLEHCRELYFSERARRESIRSSLSTPVAAISFAVFAFSTLATEIDVDRWQEPSALAILVFSVAAAVALFASAWQVVMSEWLFVYHEPPLLIDLLEDAGSARSEDEEREQTRRTLTASYAVAYGKYLEGNAVSARRRTWALRLILVSLLLQVLAFMFLPFHQST